MVDIGVNTIKKTCHMTKGLQKYIILSILYALGDLCKRLEIDSSTDHSDRYSNLFLNAYINRTVHAKYLKMMLGLPEIICGGHTRYLLGIHIFYV